MAFDIPDIRLTLNFISSSLWFFDCINSSTCSSIEANFTCFSPSFLVLCFCFLSLPCPCTNRSVLASNCSVLVSTVIYSTAHRLYNQSRILETENKRCIAAADVKRPSGGRDNRYEVGNQEESGKPRLFLALVAIEFSSPVGTKRLHRVP